MEHLQSKRDTAQTGMEEAPDPEDLAAQVFRTLPPYTCTPTLICHGLGTFLVHTHWASETFWRTVNLNLDGVLSAFRWCGMVKHGLQQKRGGEGSMPMPPWQPRPPTWLPPSSPPSTCR